MYNTEPIPLTYPGHQCGYFIPRSRDGRAILLGEIKTKNNDLFDIQLKGSGRAFLEMEMVNVYWMAIRKHIVSESVHFLQVFTTRSLVILKSGS